MDYINDRQLVANYLGGDRQAFTLIVRRHRKRMYFAARNFARNEQDAPVSYTHLTLPTKRIV